MIGPYLTDTVVQNQFKGADEYGTPTTRDQVSIKARIDYKNRLVNNANGETVVSMAKLLVRPIDIIRASHSSRAAKSIAYEDTFTFDGMDHPVLCIGRIKSFSANFLMEVWVK